MPWLWSSMGKICHFKWNFWEVPGKKIEDFFPAGPWENSVFWHFHSVCINPVTLSWRGPLSFRNQSIDLQSKSMDWFLYDNGLLHERVKCQPLKMLKHVQAISRQQPTNCLSTFDHFVGLALIGLIHINGKKDKKVLCGFYLGPCQTSMMELFCLNS